METASHLPAFALGLCALALLQPHPRAQQGFWTDAEPTTAPPFRATEGLAFEPWSGLFVMYGGITNPSASPVFSDTWAFDGCTWTQLSPAGNPGTRYDVYMARSPHPHRVVMFGGGSAPYVWNGSTWEFDAQANAWFDVTPAGPSPAPRELAPLVYDSARNRTVLFGGDGPGGFFGDTWEWDGAAWKDVTPAGPSPAPRSWHSMTYDERRGRTVLFGGYNGGQLGDTWEWDGAQWTQVFTPVSPQPQSSGAIAYDRWSERVVLFGGSFGWPSGLDGTWEYDGATWSKVGIIGGAPPPQYLQRMVGDPLRGGILLYGAFGSGWSPLPETRRYHRAAFTADDLTPAPGTSVRFQLSFPSEGGSPYFAAISLSGGCPGIPLPDGRFLPLNFDAATRASLFLDLPGTFQAFQGLLTAAGGAAPALTVPDDPLLSGQAISAAAWTVSGSAVGRISNPLELAVQ